VSQQIYYQLFQLLLIKDDAPRLIEASPPQPEEKQLTLSPESRHAELMHSPHQEADNTNISLRQSDHTTLENSAQSPLFAFTCLPWTDRALLAYAQAASLDKETINIINTFV